MELNIFEGLGVAWRFGVRRVVFDPGVLENRGGKQQEKPNISLEWLFKMKSRVPALRGWSKVELSQFLSLIEAFVINIDTINPLQKIFLFWLLEL